MLSVTVLTGAVGALGARALLRALMLAKLRRDVRRLNLGDHEPLLAGYADDAVLVFDEGEHRWTGTHRGRAAIDAFLREFTRAGLHGEVRDLWIGGPPWAMRVVARFDDQVIDRAGHQLYANRVAIVLRSRWGRIVHQEDFFADTRRIDAFEAKLRELGVAPGRGSGPTHDRPR